MSSAITSKNPFKRLKSRTINKKKSRFDDLDDLTSDGTLFRLFNFSQSHKNINQDDSCNVSFSHVLATLNTPNVKEKQELIQKKELFVDWTMRVKIRLMSLQPFPWNQKLKTCEEASAVTGFVRCIDTDTENGKINLDTSPNARFHQCCLIWQHPSIPWVDLYPRIGKVPSSNSNLTILPVKEFMHKSWIESFRSLFQLLRAKQCPYFYVITNTFVCLFRAAGINGYSEINVAVTPTSRGFRQLLKEEDIDFTMPLQKFNDKNKSPVSNESSDTGYNSLGLIEEVNNISDDDLENEEEPVKWLQDMGVEDAEIKKLNATEFEVTVEREKRIDNLPESLIFVEGVEVQAFFNFLINCKSIISNVGVLAGIPPTLLAPVAFTGASLIPLKVKDNIIRTNNKQYYSMEIIGPILPHMIHNLCDLMKNANLDTFTMTFANIECSKAFTSLTTHHTDQSVSKPSPVKTPRTSSIFGEQNLSDCGLKPKILAKFCKNEVLQYDSIKFADNQFTCL